MSQPRRSPRLAGLAAQRNARDVTISLDDDDTDSIQSTAHCEACHEEAPRSSLVRIPCCDYLAHPTCVDDGIDAMCPFCEIDLRDTLVHTGELRCPECGDHVTGGSALCMFSCCPQFPHHVECFARIAVEDNGAIFCPRCPTGRRDHVDAGWFQRLCCINGVDWPSPQNE